MDAMMDEMKEELFGMVQDDPDDKDIPDLAHYAQSSKEPLTADNYTEEDAAVLSNLAYVKFEKNESIMNGEYDSHKTVAEYANDMATYASDQDEWDFLDGVAHSSRYANCEIGDFKSTYSHYTNNDDIQKYNSQFAAFTVKVGDNKIVTFRGTDGNASAWREDLNLLNEGAKGTKSQQDAAEYLKKTADGMEGSDGHIMIAGHSKGGNNAVSSYIMNGPDVRNRVSRIDNLDGPGFNETMQHAYKDGYSELGDKLHNTYPKDSLIGQLLNNNPGSNKFVDSNVRDLYKDKWILGEHDLSSWQLTGDGKNGTSSKFMERKKSELSDLLDRGLDDTIEKMSYADRCRLYECGKVLKFPEFLAGRPEGKDLLKKFNEMSKEDKKFLALVGINTLIHTGREAAHDGAKALLNAASDKVEQFCKRAGRKMAEIARTATDGTKDLWNKASEQARSIGKAAKDFAIVFGAGVGKLWEKAGSALDHHAGNPIKAVPLSTSVHSVFGVNPRELGKIAEQLNLVEGQIKDANRQLAQVMNQADCRLLMDCMDAMKEVQKDLRDEATACDNLEQALRKIKGLYETSENYLLGQA